MVLNGMNQSFRTLSFDIGKEYNVVTVSFDHSETPELAAEKKATYLRQYNRKGGAEGWHFLTGDEANIQRLTKAAGFRFVWDDATKQFAHGAGVELLTPKGVIARYFYGIEYSPRDIRLGMDGAGYTSDQERTTVDQPYDGCPGREGSPAPTSYGDGVTVETCDISG